MKYIIVITILLIVSSCKNERNTISKDNLMSDWISNDSIFMTFEDSLVASSLFANYVYDPVAKYDLNNDSLTIYPITRKYQKSHKEINYKIIKLTKEQLWIKALDSNYIRNDLPNKIITFKNYSLRQKHNEKIKNLEFSASRCFGPCPVLDIKIQDSIIIIKGYQFVKHTGLFTHKLTLYEFDRLNKKFSRININDFKLANACPDAQVYSLYIETSNNLKIEIESGIIDEETPQELADFINILTSIEKLIDLKESVISVKFKYDINEKIENISKN